MILGTSVVERPAGEVGDFNSDLNTGYSRPS
jgi:hypothetical protein